ncbi:methyltransferase domain-containing protein [Streptomyces avermitilis]|uniref:class I SAM-dependent methyltransferase n=1 Tax=Streptomyces avermitilis TaxID=33903 RepID=UPI0033B7A60F
MKKRIVSANDLTQYDDLADQWWNPRGPFTALSWIAAKRGEMIPPAAGPGATLVDVACGGGLLHPHIQGKGYRHIGVDQSRRSLEVARAHGVDETVHTDVTKLPFDDGSVDVVVAGQCLEHFDEPYAVVAECCRILRPGGFLLLDTIADTLLARVLIVTLTENLPLPGMALKGTHDHRLFIDRIRLALVAEHHGVPLRMYGLWPRATDLIPWFFGRKGTVRMATTKSTNVMFQAAGTKLAVPGARGRA